MIECARANNAELVIVTRDSDYGIHHEGRSYINDHLKQEFTERVSKKREILLYSRLSEALKHFSVPITPKEEVAETEIVESQPVNVSLGGQPPVLADPNWSEALRLLQEFSRRYTEYQQRKKVQGSDGVPE